MTSANIPNELRKAIYRRDGYRCALCDCTQYLQIHHVIKRSDGGSNSKHNLITLCSKCHGQVHGIDLHGLDITAEDMTQYCIEYLADIYMMTWNPWNKDEEPWRKE